MAATDSTLIIEVDLACETCYTKIQKVLCKIQVKEKIKSISYDTKKNEVTISGLFNPHQLYCKLRCKAGCVIKGHKIPEKKEEEKKKKDKEEKKEKEAANASANATVNLQLTQMCVICHPWPCSDPGGHRQQTVNHHQRPPTCGVPPKCNTCAGPPGCGGCGSCGRGGWSPPTCGVPPQCNTCAGPPGCGGCGSCGGGGWWPPTPLLPPIRCPGPLCRGCNGCRVKHEQKFEYHEYPPTACIVM